MILRQGHRTHWLAPGMPGCDPGPLEEEEQSHSLEHKGVMVGHGGAPQRPAM